MQLFDNSSIDAVENINALVAKISDAKEFSQEQDRLEQLDPISISEQIATKLLEKVKAAIGQ